MNSITQTNFNIETEHWDNGTLGRDEAYVAVAPQSSALTIDDALGLQMISIRLPKELIEAFKAIASVNGMGYQPLMRTTLQRFADSELKRMALDFLAEAKTLKNAQKLTQTDGGATALKMAA
jgi:hypothetical protein